MNAVVRQATKSVQVQTTEFEPQRLQLIRHLTRDHAEIRQLATSNVYSTISTARLAELHERIERGERKLKHAVERISEIEAQLPAPIDVDNAFREFDRVWSALTTREQAELLGLPVANV